MKIALITMPFCSASRPSLGISLLQAALRRDGHECDLHYFNLDFAKRIGLAEYQQFAQYAPQESLAGDWVFSEALFGPGPNGCEGGRSRYLQEVLLARHAEWFTLPSVLQLFRMRELADGFIEDCLHAKDWSRYDLVGLTSMFQQNVASLALAQRIRKAHPQVLLAMGGANCEGEMGIELHSRFPFLDFVGSGEGDINVPELVRRLAAGDSVAGIPGIVTRDRQGHTVEPSQPVCPVMDMDSLPIPSYEDFFTQLRALGIKDEIEPLVPVETSRGCWWGAKHHCTFCGLNGSTMNFRSKSPTRALAEIEELGEKYGKNFFAVDLILDLKYLETVMPELARRDRGYTFYYETKANLKRKQMQVLAEAGVTELQAGIESLSTSILQHMRKGCTALQNIQCLKWGKQFGMEMAWNIIFGFPGEEAAEYERMAGLIPRLVHLTPPEYVARVRFDRYSPHFMTPELWGLRNRKPFQAYAYVYPFAPDALDRLAYFFEYEFEAQGTIATYTARVAEAAERWRQSAGARELRARVSAEDLRIYDTRFGPETWHVFAEPARSVYLYCDEIRAWRALRERFIEVSDGDLHALLQGFLAMGLMLEEGGHYLSLATLESSDSASFSESTPAYESRELIQIRA
jgi:ribosomal peptide maturation radical SAM protein 1